MAYKKPQDPLTNNGFGIYPLTTADQVILSDGSRLEKAGKINADKLDGRTLAEIMLALYPVGAVYISVNSTSPASLFGGTWEQIKGRFLIGTGAPENNDDGTSPGNYDKTLGSKGGEATHTLTNSEMPEHVHNTTFQWNATHDYRYTGSANAIEGEGTSNNCYAWVDNGYLLDIVINKSAGNNVAHNNMPPYLAVYMWKRVS